MNDSGAMMNDNMLKILAYLFENYMSNHLNLLVNSQKLMLELEQEGYDPAHVERAFSWLQEIFSTREENVQQFMHSAGIRVFSDEEKRRLKPEAQGIVHFLESSGVIDALTRELIIDRAMALDVQHITLQHMEWVIMLVMLNYASQDVIESWITKNRESGEIIKTIH